jgi:hypothetical protein
VRKPSTYDEVAESRVVCDQQAALVQRETEDLEVVEGRREVMSDALHIVSKPH